ncbi:hypothetical protein IKA92_02205 [bacterium]|nr:hypothetical protein [bacterium]
MSLEIKNVNPYVGGAKVATVQAAGESKEKIASMHASKQDDTKLAFTGVSKYADSSITSSSGYGLAFGAESTGVQGSGASECGRSLNLVA